MKMKMRLTDMEKAEIFREAEQALSGVEAHLAAEIGSGGFWEGELSSSALSTAVAVTALVQVDREKYHAQIEKGLDWLLRNVNPDGAWGDSPGSESNLSTTLLSWATLNANNKTKVLRGPGAPQRGEPIMGLAAGKQIPSLLPYIGTPSMGAWPPEAISSAVLSYYGNDRTFSAPILLMCALCGVLGEGEQAWRLVPQLPMELAILPHKFFRLLRLPVVSYAIPALIAVGLAKHNHSPARFPVTRYLRTRVTGRVLGILESIQPEHGGYLEAAPLTGFVVMSLASSGFRDHTVVTRGVEFLLQSQRPDGSWPIDTNLATWVTTLAVNALSNGEDMRTSIPLEQREVLLDWILSQQFKEEHVFTHAAPGGWSWTHLPGGVPDADDTSGALLALRNLWQGDTHTRDAAAEGIRWLLDLQNRDGGIPTFCKGWGKLPFDRSCPDITAHALRAWAAWRVDMEPSLQLRIDTAKQKGIRYLASIQRKDGAWVPLWFGNQWSEKKENPVYGTAQVVIALKHKGLRGLPGVKELLEKGCQWLVSAQNADSGWGSGPDGRSTIEETALALNALAGYGDIETISMGILWLTENIAENGLQASPIGLYFASLWYYEKMYPVVFCASALRAATTVGATPCGRPELGRPISDLPAIIKYKTNKNES
jgi:squalene-hopene/tetraprenyl-beta-curcumene cyclase